MSIFVDCKVELSEARRRELGLEIAGHTTRYDELEADKKDRTRDLTAKMKLERTEWTSKARKLRAGHEWVPVACIEVHDFDRNTVITKREDTGEVVSERAMRADERQQAIEFPDGEGEATEGEAAPVIPIGEKAKKTRGKKAAAAEETH